MLVTNQRRDCVQNTTVARRQARITKRDVTKSGGRGHGPATYGKVDPQREPQPLCHLAPIVCRGLLIGAQPRPLVCARYIGSGS